jgi:hypothetical protein
MESEEQIRIMQRISLKELFILASTHLPKLLNTCGVRIPLNAMFGAGTPFALKYRIKGNNPLFYRQGSDIYDNHVKLALHPAVAENVTEPELQPVITKILSNTIPVKFT